MSTARALWIYSLLARLEKPVFQDTAAVLRSLYRRCCEQRAALAILAPNDSEDSVECTEVEDPDNILAALNLMIALTGQYFGQGENATPVIVNARVHSDDVTYDDQVDIILYFVFITCKCMTILKLQGDDDYDAELGDNYEEDDYDGYAGEEFDDE